MRFIRIPWGRVGVQCGILEDEARRRMDRRRGGLGKEKS
jgi:hypothetical protein